MHGEKKCTGSAQAYTDSLRWRLSEERSPYSQRPRCKHAGASSKQRCKHRGIRPSRQSPNGHASMSAWLVARGNKPGGAPSPLPRPPPRFLSLFYVLFLSAYLPIRRLSTHMIAAAETIITIPAAATGIIPEVSPVLTAS